MSTIFIALQCFQCSTMQVKQKKKSSNKWTCVVCNQKQSVRKVFAQAFMARDVRKFVQTFNMSRQFAQQQCPDETLAPSPEHSSNQPLNNHNNTRTDWTEYIDPEDNDDDQVKDQREDVFEPKIVTELPKALFKKPKLNTNSSGLGTENGEKGFRAVFSKRNSNKLVVSQDKEPRKDLPTTVNRASKWREYTAQDEEDISADKEPRKDLPMMSKEAAKWRTYAAQDNEDDCHSTTAKGKSKWSDCMIQEKNEDLAAAKVPWNCRPRTMKGASKWDSYITEDDDEDDLQLKTGREIADHKGRWDDSVFEATLYDEGVEEDIHPDFQ
ncbi:uncharacterized protein LOC114264573 isoform X1 [Camellia sinensis]|nr:uncharacterized protein LOC114264573 isoform X1 [Camellia sinensis]